MNGKQVFAGLRWTTAATVLNLLAQVTFMAVLARQLEPAAFGLMVMASVATRFVSYFAQMGGAQVLVQAREMNPGIASAAFALSLGVSMLLYVLLSAAAPLFSAYFESPDLTHVLWAFGLTLPITAVGSLPMALLRRQGRFRATSTIEVVGYAFGYGLTGIAMASNGFGVWSLVAATVVQHGAVACLAFRAVRYPLAWPIERGDWFKVLGGGSRYSIIGFLEFLWANIEALLIGRVLGQAALGLFNRAQLICNLPVEQTVNTATKVLFPALSSMHVDRGRLGDGFLVLLVVTGVISAALSAGVSAAAPDLVGLLLGRGWAEAIPLVEVLAASVTAMFVYVVCGVTLDSMAALRPKLRMQAALLLVKVAALWSLSGHGMLGIAAAIVVCEFLRAAVGLRLVARLLELDLRMIAYALALMAVAGLAVYGAVIAVRLGTATMGMPAIARLCLQGLAGAAVLAAVLGGALSQWRAFLPLQRFESMDKWMRGAYKLVYGLPRT